MAAATPTADPATIAGYHAHIYYDADTRDRAAAIREAIGAAYPSARLGRWHDVPVGPHPQSMYQVAFETGLFPTLVPWLLLNRLGLTVLVHPETGNELRDHAIHALWLGAVLPLNLEMLKGEL